MANRKEHHGGSVQLRDPRAVALVKARAKQDDRSCANALARTVLEALANQDTPGGPNGQDKSETKSISAAGG